jgi:DNA repair protein MmcB-like
LVYSWRGDYACVARRCNFKNRVNSALITKLLAAKHSEDVFVPECKDGPSAGTTHFRVDAWAMRRSWSQPTTYGYEIKVTRSDFVRDDKWHAYLGLCSQFYFVCPDNLIQPQELPPEAGLYWVSKTGARLWLKKKAQHRNDVQVPESLFRYILMCRSKIVGEFLPKEGPGAYWKRWLEDGAKDLAAGHLVGKSLRALVQKKIHEVEVENIRLKAEREAVDETVRDLKSFGFDPFAGYRSRWGMKEKVAALQEIIPTHVRAAMEQLQNSLAVANQALAKLEAEKPEPVEKSV